MSQFQARQLQITGNLVSCKFTPETREALGCSQTAAAISMQLYLYGELSYSRNRNSYSKRYHSPLSTYTKVTKSVGQLDALGLIKHDRKPPGSMINMGRQSSMAATDELMDVISAIRRGEPVPPPEPRELIVMRDHEKNLRDYSDSRETRRMRSKLKAHGEAVMSSGITGCELGPMVRIFNEAWNRGGRAYALWQNVPKAQREMFTMSGEPMVELDYRSIHPSLLYAEHGLPVPDDCYDIPGFERSKIKLALVILINSNNFRSAVMALAAEIENNDRASRGLPIHRRVDDLPDYRLKEARQIIDAVKKHHSIIEAAFHSGAGTRLQAIDAAIAESVWWTMYKRGVVVLPVHDSFIVQASKAEMLEEVMIEAAVKVAGVALQVTH